VRSQVGELRKDMTDTDTAIRSDLDRTNTTTSEAMNQADAAARGADLARRLALGDAEFREAGRYRVYFAFDSDKLDEETLSTLDRIANEISKNPQYLVGLYGFADPTGSEAYNLQLGQRRAQAALRYLAGQSLVAFSRFQAISYGKTPPESERVGLGEGAQQRQVLILLAERVPRGEKREELSETRTAF
jgi:outer membrane protein OmpA-like peptidoglycan-associated protein